MSTVQTIVDTVLADDDGRISRYASDGRKALLKQDSPRTATAWYNICIYTDSWLQLNNADYKKASIEEILGAAHALYLAHKE